ncbi:sigma factor [Ruminococcus sp. HUN007]|uniref:RNA polymerase sigma factor n=1 Tax=Ruminococcus sp. HUN007 TaxID=1514668 RepID=UPI0006793C2A|nr:sigma factor [Ruminococcus sp. HUN007]
MEDEAIIRLYQERSEAAIAETELKYGSYCRKIADGILGDKGEVEECMNDMFMSLWNSIPPVVPRIFRAFAAKITRNLALKMYEKKKTLKRDHGQVSQTIEELAECIASGENTQAHVEHKEVIAALNYSSADFLDLHCSISTFKVRKQ